MRKMTEAERKNEILRARREVRELVAAGRSLKNEDMKEYARGRYLAWATYLKRLEEGTQERLLPMPILSMMEEGAGK